MASTAAGLESVLEKETARAGLTAHSAPLPHLVWRCIAANLADDLQSLLYLAGLNVGLKDICRPYISAFFQTIGRPVPPIPSTFYICQLGQLILEGFVDPAAIREFYCIARGTHKLTSGPLAFGIVSRRLYDQALYDNSDFSEPRLRRFDRLLRNAVCESPFIPAVRRAEMCSSFGYGDADAAMAIVVPLCTKLKLLEIPEHSPLCASVVRSIAQEYQQRGINAPEMRQNAWQAALRDRGTERSLRAEGTLPLGEVLILYGGDPGNQGRGLPLAEVIPFIGLPSLHRIVLQNIRQREPLFWPSDMTACRCPSIYFQQSWVTKRAALAFAQGVEAPSEIRQWFERDDDAADSVDGSGATWDRILVGQETSEVKTIESRLDFEGGNPGCDYAWCSWLFHGKMIDWKRSDEDFDFEEDDHAIEELMGLLSY